MSGGSNKKPLSWNNIRFNSLTEFCLFHSVTKGGAQYYVKWGKKFRGYEIKYCIE